MSQCGSQDTWLLPSCGPAVSRALGRDSIWTRHPRVLKCPVLEMIHIVSTCIPVPVLYWCAANHPKTYWLTTVTTFVLNLQFGQGSVGTACFCSVWCLLRWLGGWGPQLLATSPPLLQASIHGTSAVAVARACTLETSTWLPGCCTAWFLGSHGEGLKRTGQRLPFTTWFAKPHGPPRQKGEDLDPTTWYRSAASHTVRHKTRVLLMWLSTDYTSAATPFVRTSLLRTSRCQVSLGNTAGAGQPLQSDSNGRKALLGCSKLATCNFFMSWMGPL